MRWKLIETAPKEADRWLLGYQRDTCFVPGDIYQMKWSDGWGCWQTFGRDVHPTHWMPLPDPPAETR